MALHSSALPTSPRTLQANLDGGPLAGTMPQQESSDKQQKLLETELAQVQAKLRMSHKVRPQQYNEGTFDLDVCEKMSNTIVPNCWRFFPF